MAERTDVRVVEPVVAFMRQGPDEATVTRLDVEPAELEGLAEFGIR